MVPSKRIAPETPPETLPEDFSDWEEGGSSPAASATLPVESKDYEVREVAPPPPPPPQRERAPMQVAPSPAPRTVEKNKSSASRAQAGADSDLEAFLRRLSEVNADQAPSRQPEPGVPTNLWSPSAPTQSTAAARKEPQPAPVKSAPIAVKAAQIATKPAPVASQPAPVERESAPMFRTGYDLEEESEEGSKKKPGGD